MQAPNNPKLKIPYDDIPLNDELIKIPSYSQFIFTNRKFLQEAEKNFKKAINLLKNNCLLMDNNFKLDEVAFKAAENSLYLAEFRGRFTPKYFPA